MSFSRGMRRRKALTEIEKAVRLQHRDTLRRHRMTEKQYAALLKKQQGVCALCCCPPLTRKLSIDHDHACCPSGRGSCGQCIRWLLCDRCNLMFGYAKDDANLLKKAADMLNNWDASVSHGETNNGSIKY